MNDNISERGMQVVELEHQWSAIRRRRAFFWMIVLDMCYGYFCMQNDGKSMLSDETRYLSWILGCLCFIPICLWYARGAPTLPMFEVLCLDFCFQYSVPMFIQPNYMIVMSELHEFSREMTNAALGGCILGVSALICGYYAANKIFAGRTITLNVELPRKRAYLTTSFACGGFFLLLRSFGYGDVFGKLGLDIINVSIVILAFEWFRSRDKTSGMSLMAVTLVMMILGLRSGMLEAVLLPIAQVIIVFWYVRRRPPVALLVGASLVFLVINGIKADYRARSWFGDEGKTLTQSLYLWLDLVEAKTESGLFNPDEITASMARFDLIHRSIHVWSTTPSVIPFMGGKSYEYFKYAFIPRLLWKEKPTITRWTKDIDLLYSLTDEQSSEQGTNMAMGLIAEAYANFSMYGIFAIMGSLGFLFGTLGAFLNGRQSEGGTAVYLTLMIYFLNGIGTWAIIYLGSMIQTTIIVLLFLLPFCAPQRRVGIAF